MRYISPSKFLLITSATFVLGACQSATTGSGGAYDRDAKINAALERAAVSAEASGNAGKSLSYLERRYKRKSDDEQTAIDYAAALRKNQFLNRAAIVLAPFADKPTASSAAKSEFAAIALEQGQYDNAERYAQQAIIQDEKNFQAYHRLGIALDAQGSHEESERAFRKGLELWEGDPTPIMNNLALNLAAQEHLDEASEILQKARVISPNRTEIERNLRIVTALQQSNGTPVPKPTAKPDNS